MSMTTDVNGRQLSIIDTYQIILSDEEHDLSDIRQMSFLDNCPVGWLGDRWEIFQEVVSETNKFRI